MSHAHAYIICATPRSGSTLLCDLLSGTGVAGRPDSFFRRQSFPWWTEHFGLSTASWSGPSDFDRAYLEAVLREGTGTTGTFGMRLMWESLRDLSKQLDRLHPGLPDDAARLQAAFGSLTYVHLSRTDKVAQAISRLKAEQTGIWHVNANGTERERREPVGEVGYDFAAIAGHVRELTDHDVAWAGWFAEQAIEPVRITYESLAADPRSALSTVCAALGLPGDAARSAAPVTARLADSHNHEWAERFRKERSRARR